MLNPKQLRDYVIYPVLDTLALHKNDDQKESAAQLLLGTAMQESGLEYLHQLNGGPANGITQMEPVTENDNLNWAGIYRNDIYRKLISFCGETPKGLSYTIGNLFYAFAITRVHYYRVPEPLPNVNDFGGHAEYWKLHYNTPRGGGTVYQYLRNWEVVNLALKY